MFTHRPVDEIEASIQLLVALEEYERGLLACGRVYDPELHANLAKQFDRLRPLAAALPGLSLSWVGLLISRVDLTHSLFKANRGDPSTVDPHFCAHADAVTELKKRCARVIRGR
jgi:hypothetical protein